MDERTARGFGAAAALGAVLAVVASVPSRWFGTPQTDAYLFDPATFSPLWIERSLVPMASVLAGLLVVVGVSGLVARDRRVAGRLRRFGGYAAVAGLTMVVPALGAFSLTRTGTGPFDALVLVLGLLVGVVGVVLAVPAMIAAGVGYVRAGRSVVGYALAAGPLLAVVLPVGASAAVGGLGVGVLPAMVLFAAAPLAVGYELWTHPDPVEERSAAGTDGSSADAEGADAERADAEGADEQSGSEASPERDGPDPADGDA